jgi:SAM-dependent methyltransferase
MDQQQRVAQLFDDLAETYDAVGVEFFQPIASGLVAALAPTVGQRALDVGCGRGAALFALAAAVGPNGSAVGLDVAPRMVEATIDEAARAGLLVDARVGDAMAPDLPAGSVDVVASSLVLFFLPDPSTALRRWRELLVDGGRVGVSTFGPYDDRWAASVDGVLRTHAPAEIQDARTTGRAGPFGSDAAMEQLLSDAGYRGVRTRHAVVKPRFRDCEHWFEWSMSVGQRQFWQAIPDDQLPVAKREAFAAVDACRDDDGRIGFDQTVRYTVGER